MQLAWNLGGRIIFRHTRGQRNRNAIPREASATVVIEEGERARICGRPSTPKKAEIRWKADLGSNSIKELTISSREN